MERSMSGMTKMAKFFIMAFALILLFSAPAMAWSCKLGWVYEAGAEISSSVAAADGLVIAGDSTGRLHAVYAASGQAAWVYTGTNTVVGLPMISGKTVFFAQADGTVTALSLTDGSVLWANTPSERSYAADTVSDGMAAGDGKVFFTKGDGKMVALDAANGRPVWSYDGGSDLRSAPCFANGLVFLGQQNGIFSAVNPGTGKREWGGGAGGAINTPSFDGEVVYFSSWDGSLQAVRVKGVIPLWRADTGDPMAASPRTGADKIFAGTSSGRVIAFSKANGSVLWSFNTQGGAIPGTPSEAEGLVFAVSGDGTLFAIDAANGTGRFSFPTNSVVNGAPVYYGGLLFFGNSEGRLYAIR